MNTIRASEVPSSVKSSSGLVSPSAFYVVLWVAVSICTVLAAGRIYIRFMCFRRLLADDWLMVFAWTMLVVVAAISQTYLKDTYQLMAVANGAPITDSDFPTHAHDGLRAFGLAILFSNIGIWAIKMNFLLFFKRLGHQVRAYTVSWWIVLVVTIICGCLNVGFLRYDCMFGSLMHVVTVCSTHHSFVQTYRAFKISCILDVVTDVFIICFPVVILWRVRVGMKKKLILSAIFSLVSFTIAVTIVRGSIFGGAFNSFDQKKTTGMVTELWFWFFVEHSVSLIVACLVSFRALFVQKQHSGERNHRPQGVEASPDHGLGRRVRRIHDSILQSFKVTESDQDMELPIPASGRFSPTFLSEIEAGYSVKGEVRATVSSS